jgi:lysophosphatidate acyltransferase
MLGHIWPKYTSVTAKSDLKYYPFLGQFSKPFHLYPTKIISNLHDLVWLSKTVFIKRGNHKSAIAAFESAVNHMREERQSVFIFPEGTRSYSQKPDLLPFKKGAFHLAIKAQVPIVPVVVANYAALVSVQEKRFVPGRIPVRVLKPVPTVDLKPEDVEDVMKLVRDQMLEALLQMHAEAAVQVATNGSASISSGLREKGKIAMAS